MEDVQQRMRFSERIRCLIQQNTRFGGTGVVYRQKVEDIGTNLGMSEVGACEQFLALQGSIWDVYTGSLAFSTAKSTKTNRLVPARRWVAISDLTILGVRSKNQPGRGVMGSSGTDDVATAKERNEDATQYLHN